MTTSRTAPKFSVGDRVIIGTNGTEIRTVWGVKWGDRAGHHQWIYWLSSEALAEGTTAKESELRAHASKFEVGKTYVQLESTDRFAVDNVFSDRYNREIAVGYKAGRPHWVYQDEARFWRQAP